MARLLRDQSRKITFQRISFALLLLVLPLLALPAVAAGAQGLTERPVLVVDPDMHVAAIRDAAADAAGLFIATGSDDKTMRIWSASNGELLRTIRIPAGPGSAGMIYAVAMSPDGRLVAAGGWGEAPGIIPVYIFERETGKLALRIAGLPETVDALSFSPDGRYLAATGGGFVRVFDRDRNWSEAFRDQNAGSIGYGVAFAADDRLAVSFWSPSEGDVALYDSSFRQIAIRKTERGQQPFAIRFRPDGEALAVGHYDKPAVDLLDGWSLAPLPPPDLDGLTGGDLTYVAWSLDGQRLYASGRYKDSALNRPVMVWDEAGRGKRRAITTKCASDNTTMALLPLPAGRLLVGKFNPCFMALQPDDSALWTHPPAGGDFRDQGKVFAVSADGNIVDFIFQPSPLRFDVDALKLSDHPAADGRTQPPTQKGLQVEDWAESNTPKLDGKALPLGYSELSHSFAIHPDGRRFVIGSDWALRAFDASGKPLWRNSAPGAVWAVNISGDGRLVIGAYGDGTIRWNRMDDGREVLALQVLGNKKDWVAWTPEGFYEATPGAFGVLKWHVNRGSDAAADAVPVAEIPILHRPDALPLVLRELDIVRALGLADLAAARFDVKVATGANVAPGAQLHVLAIGISDYGEKAASLKLKYAARDANDVATALLLTQAHGGKKNNGLYAEVQPQYLHDQDADKVGIFRAFATMKDRMAKGAGQDMAVILFSGHGAMIGDKFYLLPYDVNARTSAEIKATAISAEEFQGEVAELAAYGRVLVLLDACHSGAAAGDGAKLNSNADSMLNLLKANKVTVLTSSAGGEFSIESDKWTHGAFTQALLEALSEGGNDKSDGLIWMSQLTHFVVTDVPALTGGKQHPNVEQGFESAIFIAKH